MQAGRASLLVGECFRRLSTGESIGMQNPLQLSTQERGCAISPLPIAP